MNSKFATIALLSSVTCINAIDRMTLSITAPLIIQEFNLDPAIMGIALSAFFWPYALLQFPGGRLADKFGAKKILTYFGIIWSFATASTGFAQNIIHVFVSRFFVGVGESPTIATCNKVIVDNFDSKDRGKAVGWYQSSLRLGYAISPLLMAFVLARWGWRSAFWVTGTGVLLWCIIWHYLYQRHDTPNKRAYSKQPVPWKLFLSNKATIALPIAKFCQDYTTYLLITWLPSYLVMARGFSILKMGIFASLPWLAGFASQILIGYFSDWLIKNGVSVTRARKGVQMGCQFCAASVIAVAYIENPMIAAYLLIFTVAVQAAAGGHFFTVVAEIAPPDMVGALSGLTNGMGAFAGVLAPIITGIVVKSTGSFELALSIGGAMVIISALIIGFVLPELEPIQLNANLEI
jgi:ACS family glucarate transporter-like MFS transporter